MQNFLLILPIESGIIKAVQKHAPVCRNGRRGGLKIPCANNTCGFDPHHRHKKEAPSACLGEFCFYLRRVSGSNSTALLCRASDQPCGLSLSARETPTTGIKRSSLSLSGGVLFLSAACDHDLVVCIGRDCHAGLHHFQPVHEKIVEKYRGVIKAGVNRLDGVRFQPVTVNGILKGIGQLPVPIQKLLYGRFLLLTLIAEKRFQIARSKRF